MDCKARLEQYLRDHDVAFTAMVHPTAYTAQEVAAAQQVPRAQVAKVVMVMAAAWPVMAVLPASYQIDWVRLQGELGGRDLRLAKESEFSEYFPDCDVGAMPPFGNLYSVPVYVDRTLTQDPEIVFQAGTHRDTLKMAYQDFARLVQPIVADFTEPAGEGQAHLAKPWRV